EPSADSVVPASGTGNSQNFTFTFSDSQSVSNITGVGVLFSTSSTALANSCYLQYDVASRQLSLFWDSVTGQDVRAASSATALQNSQCSVGQVTVTTAGTSLTFTIGLTFKST